MGLYASKAKKKEKEINQALGKTMVYSKKGVSSGTPSSNTPKQTLPKASETTVLPTVTKQPETKLSLMDRVKIANEKVSRVYAQSAADMHNNQNTKLTVKTIGPSVWSGGNTNLTALPKASLLNKVKIANTNANNTYAQKAADMYSGKQEYNTSTLPQLSKANTTNSKYLEPYTIDTNKIGFFDKNLDASKVWLNKSLENPATPTIAKHGRSVFDRIYNALSSIGDSSVGSDLSLKSTLKQSAKNEKDYRIILKQYDGLINELIIERDKLSPKSNEYIQYNKLIDQVYDMANSVRDRTADMTEANKFLRNASKLQEKTTEGMGTVGKNLTEAAISVGDNLVKMALTGFNPSATLVAMGASAAGQRANELSNSGVAANDALGRGIVSGVIEGLTEKIGVDNLYSIVKSNNVKVLADILKQAAAEGTEEGLGSVLNYAADRMAGDNEKFDWNDMAQSVIQGALSGAMFGIGGIVTNNAIDKYVDYRTRYKDVLPRGNSNYSSDISNVSVNIDGVSPTDYFKGYGGTSNVTAVNNNEVTSPIRIDMTEAEREPILRNTDIQVSDATRVTLPQDIVDKIKAGNFKGIYKEIRQYAQGIKLFDDTYRNENINVKFNFSNESYRKSANEQLIRKNNAKNFLYMVNDFRNIVSNAVPIEIHSDRIKGGALKNTRVLAGAFWNGENVVPVEITIKEYKQPNIEPKLYMAVTINKEGDTVIAGSPFQGPPTIAPPSTISLSDLVKGVNSNNKDFLKYFPDSMLSSEQIEYKKTALENERIKYEGKNAANVLPTANENENRGVMPRSSSTETIVYSKSDGRMVKSYNFLKQKADEANAPVSAAYNSYKKQRIKLYDNAVNEIYDGYKSNNPTNIMTELKGLKLGRNLNSSFLDILNGSIKNGKSSDEVVSDVMRAIANSNKASEVMGGIDISEDLRKYVKNRIRYSPTYATEFGDEWKSINRALGYTVKKGGADIMEVLAECNEKFGTDFDLTQSNENAIYDLYEAVKKDKKKYTALDLPTELWNAVEDVVKSNYPEKGTINYKIYEKYGLNPTEKQVRQFARQQVDENIKSSKYGDGSKFSTIKTIDDVLSDYNKITNNSTKNILNINQTDNGYSVEYGNGSKNSNIKTEYNDNTSILPTAAQNETSTITTNDNSNVLPTATDTNSNNNLGIVNQDAQQLFEDLQNAKTDVRSKARRAYQSTISGWAPFERMTKADTRSNGRNITGLVNKLSQKGGVYDSIKERGLFDINANKVSNQSLDNVVKQVPTNQLNDFNTYWHELHNIDRIAQGKPVTEHTADESRQIVAQLEAQHPEFKTYKKNISNYLDLFMRTWLVDTGLISTKDYNKMQQMYPNYIPTYRVMEKAGNGSTSYREGRKLKNRNPIGKAKGGTSEVLSFDEAMAYKMSSVVNAAIKNDISREIFSFAQAQPTEAAKNGILIKQNSANANTAIDIDSFTDELEKNIARETSKGNYEITFYDNGKPQTMKISKDVWEAYNFLDDKLAGSGYRMMAELGKKITSPMKAATTGYNPLFALTNFIRDAQTYAINNSAKNGAQAAKNYVKAIIEVLGGSDTYDQYRALGGSQNGYYGSDIYNNVYKKARYGQSNVENVANVLRKPLDLVSALGEFTEKLPRYAEYLNTIENLGNTDAGRLQASLNAADVTVNFNRTAQLSALANAWVPYFNAGLQGADRTLRQIKAHPIKTTVRATASVFLPTLLVYLINKDNPHWEDVKDGVKDNYYLIPNYAGAIDIYGYPETFIRIPKSREFGALFSASFERFIRALDESESDNKSLKETLPTAFDGYSDTLVNSFAPPDILGDNILGSMRRLGTNTAWHGGKIIPSNLTDVSPEYQYDINTSGIAKGIAKGTNKIPVLPDWTKSPMAIDYIIDSYGGYTGDVLQGLTSGKNKGSNDKETVLNSLYSGFVQPFKNRFTTDSAYSNYNLDRFYDRKEEITKAANDRDIRENLPSDYRTPEEKLESDFASAQKQISDLTKQEKEILNSNASIAEKNKKIRKLKQQKNNIAKEMLNNQGKLYKEYAANYIPEISGLSDSRQEDAKELNKKYGLSYPDFMKIYEGYSDIYNKDEKSAMKATEFDEYLNSLGYTKDKDISADIRDRFAYFTPSVAKSYYDQPSYQKVQSFMDVDTYVSIKDVLGNVSYPEGVRGAKSMAYKRAIDDFMQQHGYNPSYDERMKIYEACGVGKTYRY